jgi:Kef-type K+ transport system membrane component KefB
MSSPIEGITSLPLILGIFMILSFALLGRIGARRLGFPTVLGELLTGVLIGNLFYFWGYDLFVILREGATCTEIARLALSGHSWDEAARLVLGEDTSRTVLELLRGPNGSQYLQISQAVDLFSRYGVMFVMFHIGLGTYVIAQLRQVEPDAVRVAIIGALAPMVLGFAVISLLSPDTPQLEHIFIAATLSTTGIAITARLLTRMRQNSSREARVILGAVAIDDVLALVMLAIVSGIALTGSAAFGDIGRTAIRAFLFLVCAFGLGPYFLKFLIGLLRRLDVLEAKLFVSFVLVIFLAGLASVVELSPIVGAFAAGLLMHESHFKNWGDFRQDKHTIRELFAPLEVIIVPVFFVLMGIQVKLETMLSWQVVYVAAGLLAAAVLGKWISGLGARGKINRIAIGFGMMPRGEVGLAFAFVGKSLGVIDSAMFAVIVFMVVVTSLATPLALRLAMGKNPSEEVKNT